jgi:pimeloyl-ACP methyl ester carboxylesterase
LIAGSTLAYINKAGHFPWIEQQDEFRKIVTTFLGKP